MVGAGSQFTPGHARCRREAREPYAQATPYLELLTASEGGMQTNLPIHSDHSSVEPRM